MAKYVLKLRQDNDIPRRMRNHNWDLADAYPGFLIQLQVNHVALHTEFPRLRRINATSHKFFYMEGRNFLSYSGIHQFLVDILSREQVPLHHSGRILCPSGLQLLSPNLTQSSESICFLQRLAAGVSRQVRWIYDDPRNRHLKFVPIAMYLEVLEFHQSQCVDDSVILEDQLLEANASNLMAQAPLTVTAVQEEIIQDLHPDKGCPICLEDICVGQRAARMPCTHLFHAECIGCWLEKASSCPLCRGPASLSLAI